MFNSIDRRSWNTIRNMLIEEKNKPAKPTPLELAKSKIINSNELNKDIQKFVPQGTFIYTECDDDFEEIAHALIQFKYDFDQAAKDLKTDPII